MQTKADKEKHYENKKRQRKKGENTYLLPKLLIQNTKGTSTANNVNDFASSSSELQSLLVLHS